MENIGENLKKARNKKKISVDKVYRDTKIHPKIILALEEGKIDDLPDPIYVKSFVRKYAKYLGLDPQPLLKKYSVATSDNKPLNFSSVESLRTKGNYIKKLVYFKNFIYFILSISIILIIVWSVNKIYHRRKTDTTSLTSKSSTVSSEKVPLEEVLVPPNESLKLKIQTTKDTWIQVKADQTTVFQKVLHKGSTQEFNANNQFRVWVGKASGVNLYLNNIPLKPLGSGVVKNIVIDRSGISISEE